MQRSKLVTELESSMGDVDRHLQGPESELDRAYGAGKWTARMLLAHLADCEFINLFRFCKAVAEPGSTVDPFQHEQWATSLGYSARSIPTLRSLFLGARGQLIEAVRTLPEEALDGATQHPEKGEMSGWAWAALNVGHCAHHLSQVEAARSGQPWVKPVIAESHLFGA